MKKKHKLGKYILFCFVGFAFIILAFLWIFEVSLFSSYYQYSKTKTAIDVAKKVSKYYETGNYEEILDILSYEKGVCVDISYRGTTIYTSDSLDKGCLLNKHNDTVKQYKTQFELSNEEHHTYRILNTLLKNKTLMYATKLDDQTFLYVNTSIEPVESSVKLLKEILIYITIVVFIMSILLSIWLSKVISRPIVKLNKKATHLAKSEFSLVDKEINTDIYEIEELNDTLNYASEELSKIDETRRDLLANVSHDLKTPLTMIKAYAEMTRDLNSKDKKKSEENMNIIIEETDRLNNLVNDILELSKLQSNISSIEKTTFDLTELINNIIKRFNIYEKNEEYNFIFDYKDSLLINADKPKIEQVIYNLISNAMNYTGSDKKVIIEIKEGVNNYRVSIKDTGKGIDENEIDKIWDKYYKNELNHKRNKVGTGLGLSIVKEILINHKYNYGVKSEKGKYTEFYFDIPKESIK